jgi:hypothetical protein
VYNFERNVPLASDTGYMKHATGFNSPERPESLEIHQRPPRTEHSFARKDFIIRNPTALVSDGKASDH